MGNSWSQDILWSCEVTCLLVWNVVSGSYPYKYSANIDVFVFCFTKSTLKII